MKRILFLLLAFCLVSFSFGRVGPVSQYGQLLAGKAGSKGQIYGSCEGIKSGKEVAVQGMSLFWSISSDVGSPFWTSDIVSELVSRWKIQLIRAPMGVDEDWGSGNYFTRTGDYQSLMNTVVQAGLTNSALTQNAFFTPAQMDDMQNAYKRGTNLFILRDSTRCFIVPVAEMTSAEKSMMAQQFGTCIYK